MPRTEPIKAAHAELGALITGLRFFECDGHPASYERNLEAIEKMKLGLDRFFEAVGREAERDGVNVDLVDYKHVTDGLAENLIASLNLHIEEANEGVGTFAAMANYHGGARTMGGW